MTSYSGSPRNGDLNSDCQAYQSELFSKLYTDQRLVINSVLKEKLLSYNISCQEERRSNFKMPKERKCKPRTIYPDKPAFKYKLCFDNVYDNVYLQTSKYGGKRSRVYGM